MRPIAFFDVDRTLIDGYTGYETSLFLVKKGLFKKRRILQVLYYKLANLIHLAPVLKMYEIASRDLVGQHISTVRMHGRHVFDTWFAHRVFQEGVARVEQHRADGHELVLLSSGPYMTVEVLHDRLGTDHCYSMGPALDEAGLLLDAVRLPVTVDACKLDVARRHAAERGVALADCYFYTDSVRDLALLAEVGHPLVVNPDRRLRREAVRRGWPIEHWRAHAPPLRTPLLAAG